MITITINSVDRSDDIEKESPVLQQTLSKEPAVFSFRIKGLKNQPTLGQSVVVAEPFVMLTEDGGTILAEDGNGILTEQQDGANVFRGTIVEKRAVAMGGVMVGYDYVCMDGYYTLDRKLVIKAYSNTTARAVVEDILTNFVSGITLEAPATSPTIKTARFNYENPSRCIQQIANNIGWDWYIDAENVLHFFPPETTAAPFEVQDNNGTAIANSLRFDSNIVELKNVVYVRGGEYLDPIAEADAVDKYAADGDQVAFPLVYRYNSVQVTLNGTPQTVGVDFLDDPADTDVLYNFQEKMVKWREDNKPDEGDVVRVFGNAYVPLIVQAIDSDSIVAYGEKEGIQIDRTITSIEEAELLANSLLEKWREGSLEGVFRTREQGLRVGMAITINSTRFGVNRSYRVNRLQGTVNHHGEFEYRVEFLTSGQTTLTDILLDLIGKERKNIEISPDEVIQKFRQVEDMFGMTDEIVEITSDSAPYHYGVVSAGNEGKYNFATYT